MAMLIYEKAEALRIRLPFCLEGKLETFASCKMFYLVSRLALADTDEAHKLGSLTSCTASAPVKMHGVLTLVPAKLLRSRQMPSLTAPDAHSGFILTAINPRGRKLETDSRQSIATQHGGDNAEAPESCPRGI
jgi:hypothetical protein